MDSAKKEIIEDLAQPLQARVITKERFRLPMDEERAFEFIMAANVAEVKRRFREFCYNDAIEEQARQVAKCLTANDSKFGIVLCGGFGNGKTTMMKALQNLLNYLKIPNPNQTSSTGYNKNYGLPIINVMDIVEARKSAPAKFQIWTECDMLGIDDLGTEPVEIMDYGNVMCPIVELLTKRYDAKLFTIITTNLEPKDIRQRYGPRIADRLNEMMTKVIYRNPTYRTGYV